MCETVLPLKVFLSFDQRVYLTILSKQLWFRRKTVKWYEDMKIRRYYNFSGLLTSLLAGLQNVNRRFKSDFRLKYLPTTPPGKMWRQTSTLLNENKCLFVTSRECQRQCKGLWRSSLGWSTPARTSRGQSHKSGSFFMIKLLFNVSVQSNVTFIVLFRLCSDTFSMISFFDLTSWFGRWVE